MASDAEKPHQKRTSDVEILENVKFSEIGLSVELVKSLAKNGFIRLGF
jgi:superfamily II DNA/RNA helicase